MYPYRSQTAQSKTSIKARETEGTKSILTIEDLKQDKRLLELLHIAIEETEQSQAAFDALLKNTAFGKDIETLRNAYLDEIKHKQQLQEMIYTITGKAPAETPAKTAAPAQSTESPASLLEKTLLQEMESSDFFRELLLSIPQTALRDILFEIMTDKQDHCVRLCFLFTKYQ